MGLDRRGAAHAGAADRLVLLPRCSHWIQQERPDDLNAEMIDFLRRDSGL